MKIIQEDTVDEGRQLKVHVKFVYTVEVGDSSPSPPTTSIPGLPKLSRVTPTFFADAPAGEQALHYTPGFTIGWMSDFLR